MNSVMMKDRVTSPAAYAYLSAPIRFCLKTSNISFIAALIFDIPQVAAKARIGAERRKLIYTS